VAVRDVDRVAVSRKAREAEDFVLPSGDPEDAAVAGRRVRAAVASYDLAADGLQDRALAGIRERADVELDERVDGVAPLGRRRVRAIAHRRESDRATAVGEEGDVSRQLPRFAGVRIAVPVAIVGRHDAHRSPLREGAPFVDGPKLSG